MNNEDVFEEFKCIADDQDMPVKVLEGYDYHEAIIGYTISGEYSIAIYDYTRCLDVLMLKHGIESYEEATDWFSYNTMRGLPYIEEPRPIIMQSFNRPDVEDQLS